MLKKAKLKVQLLAAFLAIATAMSVPASAQTTKTQIQRIVRGKAAPRARGPVAPVRQPVLAPSRA